MKRLERFQERANLRAETIGEEENKKKIIRGYPILFDSPAEVGEGWTEFVRRGALNSVDLGRLLLLSQHRTELPLARNGINMRAEVDDVGLFVEAELPNTAESNDVYELVRSGIVDGMSYWFEASEVRRDSKNKTIEILKFSAIHEVSIITFPAYRETLVIAHEPDPKTHAKRAKLLL